MGPSFETVNLERADSATRALYTLLTGLLDRNPEVAMDCSVTFQPGGATPSDMICTLSPRGQLQVIMRQKIEWNENDTLISQTSVPAHEHPKFSTYLGVLSLAILLTRASRAGDQLLIDFDLGRCELIGSGFVLEDIHDRLAFFGVTPEFGWESELGQKTDYRVIFSLETFSEAARNFCFGMLESSKDRASHAMTRFEALEQLNDFGSIRASKEANFNREFLDSIRDALLTNQLHLPALKMVEYETTSINLLSSSPSITTITRSDPDLSVRCSSIELSDSQIALVFTDHNSGSVIIATFPMGRTEHQQQAAIQKVISELSSKVTGTKSREAFRVCLLVSSTEALSELSDELKRHAGPADLQDSSLPPIGSERAMPHFTPHHSALQLLEMAKTALSNLLQPLTELLEPWQVQYVYPSGQHPDTNGLTVGSFFEIKILGDTLAVVIDETEEGGSVGDLRDRLDSVLRGIAMDHIPENDKK